MIQTQHYKNIADQAHGFKGVKNAINKYNAGITQTDFDTEKFVSTVNLANPSLGKYLSSLKDANGQYRKADAGLNGYAGSLITAAAKTVALQAATMALNTAIYMGISFVISEVISVISACVTASSRLQESAKDLSSQFSSTQSDIDGYKTKIADLYAVINDGSSSYEETYNARQQLLSIQNEMIEKFGSEAEAVRLVTDAVNGQTDALDSLTQLQWNETVDKFNYDPDRKWTEKFGDEWANFWSGSSDNYERMQKEMENTTASFNITPKINDKKYEKFAEILQKDFDAEVTGNVSNGQAYYNTFTLSGNLTDIYTQLQNIRDLAKDMGLDDSYINAISEQSAKTKSTLDSYQEFFNQGILQDRIIGNKTYEESFRQIENAYKNYQKAFSSGDKESIDKTKQSFAETVQNATDGVTDKSVTDYFNTMYPQLQEAVGSWEFEVHFKAALDDKSDDFEKDVQKHVSEFKNAEAIRNYSPETATDAQKEAYAQLDAIADYYHLTIDQLIDKILGLGIVSSQVKDDLLNKLAPSANSPVAGIQSELSSAASAEQRNTATKWVDSLSNEEAMVANSDEFEFALEAQREKLNGAALSAKDYDAALRAATEAQGSLKTGEPSLSSLPEEWDSLKTTSDNELKNTREELLALAEAGRLTEETFHKTAGADTFLGKINESLPETIRWINQLVSSSDQLASMKKGISSISSALGTKNTDKYVDADTLNGFSPEIKGLESWEEFEQLLGSNESSMKDCKKAANRLASEYVNSSNFLSNLNEENKDYYITQLENMGIANAREVVEHELENIIKAQEYATILLTDSKYKLIGADTEEQASAIRNAQALLTEGAVSDQVRMQIFQLAAQEQVLNNNSLNVSDKISALSALATAYLGTAQAARVAAYAEHLKGAVEGGMPEAAAEASFNSWLKQLSNETNKLNTPEVNLSPHYTGDNRKTPKGGDSPKTSETKTSIDWIDRRLTVLQKKIDATKAKFENLFSVKKKANNLDKQIKETTALLKATEKAAKQYKKKADKIKLSEDKKENKDLKKKVREGSYSINDYSQETAEKINKYKDYYDKYKDLQKQVEELEKQNRESEEEKYQLYVDNAEAKLDRSRAHAELDEGNYKEQNKHLEKQKKYLEESYKYQIKIARQNHDKVEVSKLQAELEKQLRDLTKEEFDNIAAEYENKIGFIEGKMDIINSRMEQLEAKGYVVSKTYYNQLISQENKNLAQLKKERDALQKQMDKGLKDGSIVEGTTSWYEMMEAINEVDNATIQATTSMIEYQNQLRQLEWDAFDRMQDHISQIQNEAGFLTELMENEKLFHEDNGQWTEYADAAAGLHAVSYNTYMVQADDYAKEIKKISKELASDPYNTVLAERRQELINAQQEAIRSAESEKQSIKSLVSDGYDVMTDALQKMIDRRKELLDTEKNSYDYEKKISEQAKNVLNLEKQKLSIQGDDSEEAVAKLQQITLKLDEARGELEESEYEQWRTDQEQMLDKLTDDVNEWVSQRLDNTDSLVSEVISSANANASDIHNTLERVGNDVGYMLTDEMQRIWDTDSSVVAVYGDSFHSQLTAVNSTLMEIRNFISAMQQNSEWESFVNGGMNLNEIKNTFNGKEIKSVKHSGSSSAFSKISASSVSTFKNKTVAVTADSKNGSPQEARFVRVQTGEEKFSQVKPSTIKDIFMEQSPAIDIIKPLKYTPVTPDIRAAQNNFDNVNVDITLPNVKNYDEFVSELSKDRHFEKVIQSMTLGNALGRNSMNKFRV